MPALKSILRLGVDVLIIVLITVASGMARWSKFEGQIVHGNATYDDNGPTFTDDAYLKLELQRSTIFLRDNRAFEDRFAAALSYISEMKRLCDGRNIGLTIVLIPDEMQVRRGSS